MSTAKILHVDFKVFGKVHNVYFRKYAKIYGLKYHLRGWVQQASDGTVIGSFEGEDHWAERYKKWLSTTGSPLSKIEKCVFKEKEIKEYELKGFNVYRNMFWTFESLSLYGR